VNVCFPTDTALRLSVTDFVTAHHKVGGWIRWLGMTRMVGKGFFFCRRGRVWRVASGGSGLGWTCGALVWLGRKFELGFFFGGVRNLWLGSDDSESYLLVMFVMFDSQLPVTLLVIVCHPRAVMDCQTAVTPVIPWCCHLSKLTNTRG
jgi:hypothetical protein